jgi:hypothetical protein
VPATGGGTVVEVAWRRGWRAGGAGLRRRRYVLAAARARLGRSGPDLDPEGLGRGVFVLRGGGRWRAGGVGLRRRLCVCWRRGLCVS